MQKENLTICLILILGLNLAECKLSCLDNDNNPTDWVFSNVFPGSTSSQLRKEREIASGRRLRTVKPIDNDFAYTDSKQTNGEYKVMYQPIDTSDLWLANTVNQVNNAKNHKVIQKVAWNDQNPNGDTNGYQAHSKGFIVFEEETDSGFYILHSIPKYPKITTRGAYTGKIYYSIPEDQQTFAQHMICFSLTGSQINEIAGNLIITNPNIYYDKITTENEKYSNLTALVNKDTSHQIRRHSPDFIVRNLNIGGQEWELFSVFSHAKLLLWDDVIAPQKNINLVCETWGRPQDEPLCNANGPTVENTQQIKLNDEVTWQETQDHSKWCVQRENEKDYYVCIGDMNRMESQRKRGGGAMCTKNRAFWNTLRSVQTDIEECENANRDVKSGEPSFETFQKSNSNQLLLKFDSVLVLVCFLLWRLLIN